MVRSGKDLYGVEEFYDNYMVPINRNYDIYGIKYEQFWNNIGFFNYTIGIPDVKELYPIKQERAKKFSFVNELSVIYKSLITKMYKANFIEVIKPNPDYIVEQM